MGLLDDEGLGAAFGNEMLRRRATNERARMLARQQEPSLPPDINSSQFPRVNAAIQGLLGTAPDEMGISVLNRSAVASVLFIMARPFTALSPASMASGLVVSRDKGTLTTCWTVRTIQSMTSGPAFFWGPMLRSRMSAPWATCLTARS